MRTFYLSLFLLVGSVAVSQNLPFTVGIPPAPGSNTVEAGKSITISPGYSTTPGGTYVFRIISDRFINEPDPATTNNYNFIKTEEAYLGNIIDMSAATPFQKKISYQYFDGLGRPMQSISVKSSPDFRDVVVPITYDAFGRQNKQYMPYVVTNDGRFQPNGVNDQSTYYNQSSIYNYKVQLDSRPFSETLFEASPLNRPLTDFGPGNLWYTNNKSIGHGYLVNVDGNSNAGEEKIISWSITSVSLGGQTVYIPSGSISYYASGSLSIKSTTDEQGHAVREYVDKLGKTILKKVQMASSPATYTDADWALTYYIYDDFDRLRFVLPPEFNTKISTYTASGDQGKSDLINAWCFQYQYDERGRMITKQVPGAEVVEMVYDKWDRLAASRDGNQRAANKWSFTKYDVLNRPIITGEISSSSSRDAIVTTVNGISNRYEYTSEYSAIGYTLSYTFPTGAGLGDVNTATFYDDYTWQSNLFLGSNYDFQSQSGFTGTVTSKTRGLATGTKVRILNSSNFLITATYYDDQYRVLQSIGDDHLGNKNRTTNEYYGITGWVTKSLLQHGSALTSLSETDYDHTGRVMKTYLTLDGGTRVVTSQMQYNELGQLVDKKLHSTDNGSTYLQSVDYRYNIRGWLKSINNGQLTMDNDNDESNDLFGMNLNYEQAVAINGSNTTAQFNGNISSISWSSNNLVDPMKQKIYGYAYDNVNRLSQATYAANNAGNWNTDVGMFNEGLTYDKNGNILSLNRTGLFGGATQSIDLLGYRYATGNRLTNVHDNSGYYDKNANNPDYGFSELIHSTGITEYTYDANGNMTTDLNKGITGISYNYLNKPTAVTLSAGTINYTYDAVGTKLKKVAGSNSSDYVGPIQYENTKLAFISLPEGRAVKTGTGWNYEYFLKDHLGNNRVVFGYENIVDSYTATMEIGNATVEENTTYFNNVAASRVQFASMNHTSNSYINPVPDRAAETNGYLGKPVGPAKMLQVHTGDTVNISVYARYTAGTGGVNSVISNLVSALAGAYSPNLTETASTAFNNNLPGIVAGQSANGNAPKAYLFYIMFSSDFTSNQFGFAMIDPTYALNNFQKLKHNIVVPANFNNGFLYTYVANESNVAGASSVYFDDMTVRHWQTAKALQVAQVTEYYPFGLAINQLAYNRSAIYKNDYKYNGKEEQTELNLGWLDYGQRMYQPELGRFFVQDRFAEKYYDHSPYSYALNNPALYIDINGDSVWTTHASTVDKNGNTTITHTVHVQGKVLNQSNGATKASDVAKGLNARLNAQSSITTKNNDDGTTTTEVTKISANYAEAKSMDDVTKSDHLVVMVDGVLGKASSNLGGGEAVGLAKFGGKISYIEGAGAVETAFHEVGHNLGLPHPGKNNSGDPMSYTGRGANFSPAQMNVIYENSLRGIPNRGSNYGVMGNHFPNVPQGTFYGTSNNDRPFKSAPGQRAHIPLPLINSNK